MYRVSKWIRLALSTLDTSQTGKTNQIAAQKEALPQPANLAEAPIEAATSKQVSPERTSLKTIQQLHDASLSRERRTKRKRKRKLLDKRRFRQGQRRFRAGDLEEALRVLAPLVNRRVPHFAALHICAHIYVRFGEKYKARRACLLLLRQNRFDLHAIRNLRAIGSNYTPRVGAAEWMVKQKIRSPVHHLEAARYFLEIDMPQKALDHVVVGIGLVDKISDPVNRLSTLRAFGAARTRAQKKLDGVVVAKAREKFDGWKLADALSEVQPLINRRLPHVEALRLSAAIFAILGESYKARRACILILRQNRLNIRAIRQLKAIGTTYRPRASSAEWMVSREPASAERHLQAVEFLLEIDRPQQALDLALAGMNLVKKIGDEGQSGETLQALRFQCGRAREAVDDFTGAIEWYEQIDPDSRFFAKGASPWARCLLELGRTDEAEQILLRVRPFDDGPLPFNGALLSVYYRQGRIGEAHRLYHGRRTANILSEYFHVPHAKDVQLLSGRHENQDALFVAEGGPGDEIRISSTYVQLAGCVKRSAFSCDPRLHSLLSRSFPSIEFVPARRYRIEFLAEAIEERQTLTDQRLFTVLSDRIIHIAKSKSLVLSVVDTLADTRIHRESFRDNPGRFKADPLLVKKWRKRLECDRPNIGISWRSLLLSPDRNRHYLKAEDLKLLKELDVNFWILQPGFTHCEQQMLAEHLRINVPDIDLRDDFEEQAALMTVLDAVVAPLTTTAELAGMLGVKTIIFCRTHSASWRQCPDGSDVWYENARLVVGKPIQDVTTLLRSISEELKQLR